jgi:hypothetical protein
MLASKGIRVGVLRIKTPLVDEGFFDLSKIHKQVPFFDTGGNAK